MGDLSEHFRSVRDIRTAHPRRVEVDFGAGITALDSWTQVLDLRPGKHGIVPADGLVRWDALQALPQLLTVEWSGPDRGITEAVAAHSSIRFLYWSDAEGDIDLSHTNLGTLHVDGVRVRSLRLPTSIESLSLGRARAGFGANPPTATVSSTLRVDAPNDGQGLILGVFHYGAEAVIPHGVRRVSSLWLWVGGQVSAAVMDPLTDLEELRLTFDRAPGTILDLPRLDRHTNLRQLQFDDAYGLAVDDLPALPALRLIELHGTRRATAAAVKARYRGSGISVRVSGAMTNEWLARYMDNPFCDWIEDSKSFGKAACEAFDRARQAADLVGTGHPNHGASAEGVLRGLVADLNAINDKYQMIDTLRREQAWDAYCVLAHKLDVPIEQADAWFDDGRSF